MRVFAPSSASFVRRIQSDMTLGQLHAIAPHAQKALEEEAIQLGLTLMSEQHIRAHIPNYDALGEDKLAGFNAIAPEFLQIHASGIKSLERSATKIRSRIGNITSDISDEQLDASLLVDSSRVMLVVSTPELGETISKHLEQNHEVFDTGWQVYPSLFINRQIILHNQNLGCASEIQLVEPTMHNAEQATHITYEIVRKITDPYRHVTPTAIDPTLAHELSDQFNQALTKFHDLITTHHLENISPKTPEDFSEHTKEAIYEQLSQLEHIVFLDAVTHSPPEWQALYVALIKQQNALLPEALRIDPNALPQDIDPQLLQEYERNHLNQRIVYATQR